MNRFIPASVVGCYLSDSPIDIERFKKYGRKNTLTSLTRARLKSKQHVVRKMQEVGAPGMVVAVSVDGITLWSQGFGLADVENNTPCTANTVMRIASISKPFTAAVMARLWEAGKLDLDKPIQQYLSDYPEKYFNGKKVDITMRKLLSHTSGIRHYEKAIDKSSDNEKTSESSSKPEEKSEFKTKEFLIKKPCKNVTEALKMFKDDELIVEPGKEFYYSTHAWTLISAVMEKVAQQDFLSLMNDNFRRLGMHQTVPDFHENLIYGRARCYKRNKKGKLINAPYVDISYKWAGGGFLSTVGDLIKFGNAMIYSYQQSDSSSKDSRIEYRLPGFLKSDTIGKLWSPIVKPERKNKNAYENTSYGLGWFVYPEMEERGCCPEWQLEVAHTGGAVGASSVLFLMPNTKAHDHRVYVTSHSCSYTDEIQELKQISDDSAKEDSQDSILLPRDNTEKPIRGVTVAIITNMEGVGLTDLARSIGKEFDEKLQTTL